MAKPFKRDYYCPKHKRRTLYLHNGSKYFLLIKTKLTKRRTKWLYLNVKNVVRSRKADANQKNVPDALKQEPCRRRRRNLPVAVVPVQQKNNFSVPSPCQNYMAGAFFIFPIAKIFPHKAKALPMAILTSITTT